MARWTRLELATPCVTGRYSNQLNYHRSCVEESKLSVVIYNLKMVGITRLELVTSTL